MQLTVDKRTEVACDAAGHVPRSLLLTFVSFFRCDINLRGHVFCLKFGAIDLTSAN